jgi:hypothetical protein
MNKAITDGLVLMPPPFASGLGVWSSGDGTPGSATYQGASNAALVPADQDFGGCLELLKTESTQKLRHMGETPIIPGCYLRVSARVKVLSGNIPTIRVAAWAGAAGGAALAGVPLVGPAVTPTVYGEIVRVSAIVGTGARPGVDLPWGQNAIYGHFGIDLTGHNGGVVRIDDIEIEDVTSVFLRTMMDWVDVRDYGARGDGVTNDRAAFLAADAAAAGRELLVPAGDYLIASTITINSPVRFEGRLVMPVAARLVLAANYDLPSYIEAFGGDEMQGLRKALQALFNYTDHDSLDMRGRRVEVTEPIDVQAAVENKDIFAVRRVLRNGQLNLVEGPAWDTIVATSQATYSPSNANQLTGVANVANIPVGSLVTGAGVGREVYVREKNVGAGTVTLSRALYGATGTQTYTFRRFRYALDFSNFAYIDKFVMQEVEIQCNGAGSGVLLPPDGFAFQFSDCHIIRPKDRGITSHGRGCAGIQIDRCQFLSNEQPIRAQDRTTVAFNVNSNDAKIRDCRAMKFAHFAVMAGTAHIITGNHFFNGDDEADGVRLAGLVLTEPTSRTTITGNYIDNCFLELTNEHDAAPDWNNEFSFGGITITGNVFFAGGVAPWFRWIVVKPFGPGHFLQGINVSGNTFQAINTVVERVEKVDTSFATLDMTRARNVMFKGNSFNNVSQWTANPATLPFTQNTAQTNWTCEFGPWLPFDGRARVVSGIVAEGPVTNASNQRVTEMPCVELEQGPAGSQVRLNWSGAARGKVRMTARMDNPH